MTGDVAMHVPLWAVLLAGPFVVLGTGLLVAQLVLLGADWFSKRRQREWRL